MATVRKLALPSSPARQTWVLANGAAESGRSSEGGENMEKVKPIKYCMKAQYMFRLNLAVNTRAENAELPDRQALKG